MHGDYGYMEDGKLGKAYNFKLLKRLANYLKPYRKMVVSALLLSVLLTFTDLAIPYLSKIAIDQYIRASWYKVDTKLLPDHLKTNLTQRYGHLLVTSLDRSIVFISHSNMNEIDPADLKFYKTSKVITTEQFYKIRPDLKVTGKPSEDKPVSPVILMSDGSKMMDHALLSDLPEQQFLDIRSNDLKGVALVAALALFLIAVSFGLNYGEYYILALIGQRTMQDIRNQLFRNIQSNSLSFFDRNPVGRLVTRVTNDIQNLDEMFRSVAITVFKDVFILLGILSILLYLNWRLSLLCFALIPFISAFTIILSRMARDAFRALREAVARINAFLQERISGMQVIQLFCRESIQMAAFTKINHQNYMAGMKQVRVFAVFMPIMELFSAFAVALLIWHGGAKVMADQMSLGTLVVFISYIQMFFKPIRDISEKYNIMQSAMASTERIFEYMDHIEKIPEPDQPQTPSKKPGHLIFNNVSFGYQKDHPVIQDISFEVKPGETIAVVGATGAGKTTLINLVERFYDPDQGEILLDGIDLRKWSKSALRQNIGLCMQDVFIFSGTPADNISLARDHVSNRMLEQAAVRANALSFIQKLKHGFNQELGERGASLSTGQRQLLSFARALASEPQLLILDEATSSVDPETERLIQEAIARISTDRTTLIVAHRLSTIRNADRILVMHQGRITEQGNHEELMAIKGIYYKLNMFREAEGHL